MVLLSRTEREMERKKRHRCRLGNLIAETNKSTACVVTYIVGNSNTFNSKSTIMTIYRKRGSMY